MSSCSSVSVKSTTTAPCPSAGVPRGALASSRGGARLIGQSTACRKRVPDVPGGGNRGVGRSPGRRHLGGKLLGVMETFGTVLIVVSVIAVIVAAISYWGSGRLYRGLGRGGDLTLNEPSAEPPRGGPAADREAR